MEGIDFEYTGDDSSSGLSKWLKKFRARVVESKWTKLFALASILQLCMVVILEARVLSRNNTFRRKLIDDIPNPTNCTKHSIDRMLLIEQENAIFMIFQLFQVWFCLNAIYNQNTIQIITIAVINFLCGLCGIVQIFEVKKWNADLDACEIQENISKDFSGYDVPLVACLLIFSLVIGFLSWKLYQQFGWNIYKRIGADTRMQKIYKTMLIFVMYLKLGLFFVLVTAIEVFMAFNVDTPRGNDFIFTLPKGLYYFHMAVTIMIFLLELLAYASLQRESKVGMITYLVLSICTVADFFLLLRYATKTLSQSWYFFILFVVVAILLSILTWIWGILVLRNFDKGLMDLLDDNMKEGDKKAIDDD